MSGVGNGLEAGVGGHVRVEGNAEIMSNSVHGIAVGGGGTAVVDGGASISGNSADGIHVEDGGAAIVQGGSIISGNAENGIFAENGNVHIGDSDGPATIENNGLDGIFLWFYSIGKFNNASNQIINNSAYGVYCFGPGTPPSNPMIYNTIGTFGTVSGNVLGQISCNSFGAAKATRKAGGTR